MVKWKLTHVAFDSHFSGLDAVSSALLTFSQRPSTRQTGPLAASKPSATTDLMRRERIKSNWHTWGEDANIYHNQLKINVLIFTKYLKQGYFFSSAVTKIAHANCWSNGGGGFTLFRNLNHLIPDRKAFHEVAKGIAESATEGIAESDLQGIGEAESATTLTPPELILLYCQMRTTTEEDPRVCQVWRKGSPPLPHSLFRHHWEGGDLLALNGQTHYVEQHAGKDGSILMRRVNTDRSNAKMCVWRK